MIIGVVGKSGAGKNVVAKYLEDKGFKHYDFDVIAHDGLEANKFKIASVFGKDVIKRGKVDRKRLGDIVFNAPCKLKLLESILWKWIDEKVEEEYDGEDAVMNAALLYTSSMYEKCDVVFWVYAPVWVRIKRLLKRDDRTFKQIVKRLQNQKHIYKSKYPKSITLWNTDKDKLYKRIDKILNKVV
jgi:dephospho-CoA kinase